MLTSRDTPISNSLLPPSALAAEKFPRSVAFTPPIHSTGRLLDPAKEPRVAQSCHGPTNGTHDSNVRLLVDRRLQRSLES